MMQKKKGVALIWALVTSTALLIVSSTMANSIFKESAISIRTDSSTAAYAAAKSGIEWGRHCINNQELSTKCNISIGTGTHYVYNLSDTVSGTTYDVVFTDMGGGETKIESTGQAGDVRRKIEYVMKKEPWKTVPYQTATNVYRDVNASGSYSQQFDLWHTTDMVGPYEIGLGSSTGAAATKTIGLYYDGAGKFYINSRFNGDKKSVDYIDVSDLNLKDDEKLQARVDYIKDTAVKLTIYTRQTDLSKPDTYYKKSCFYSITLDVSSLDSRTSFLDKVFLTGTTTTGDPKMGDGSTVTFTPTTGSGSVVIDRMSVKGSISVY